MLRHHSLLSCSYVTLALLAFSATPSAAMDDLALDTGAEMISLDSLPEALPDLAEEIAAPTETAAPDNILRQSAGQGSQRQKFHHGRNGSLDSPNAGFEHVL